MDLRDYQREGADALLDAISPAVVPVGRGARVMYQLPTGGGKTAVAGEVVAEYLAANEGAKALWLTHRIELVRQSGARLIEAHGVDPLRFQVLSPVSAKNRLNGVGGVIKPRELDLLICDEAHHTPAASWAGVLKRWLGPAIGLTATPWRLAKKEGFDHLWTELICGPSVAELVSAGWLAKPRVVTVPDSMRHVLGRGYSGGDYNTSMTWADEENRVALLGGGLRWAEGYDWRKILVYALSVKHATEFAEIATEGGYKVGLILGKKKGDDDYERRRARTMEAFREGEIDVLVNVETLTEGVDVPDADAALILRPTRSLALWLQMAGRVLRPADGKDHGLVLDATDNHRRLDLPDADREWSLKPRENHKPGPPILKTCQGTPQGDGGCATENYGGQHNCTNCGAPFGAECANCGRFRSWRDWQKAAARCDQCIRGEEAEEAEKTAKRDGRSLRDMLEVGVTSQKGNQVAISAGMRWWRDTATNQAGAFVLRPRDRQIASQVARYGLGTMEPKAFVKGIRAIARQWGYRFGGGDNSRLLGVATLADAEHAHAVIDGAIRQRAKDVAHKYR